jgi:hypothetical protein
MIRQNKLITGIEKKLNERQRKKDLENLKSKFGFYDEDKDFGLHKDRPNFHIVNQLYDKTQGFLKKGRLSHTETFLTQVDVSARAGPDGKPEDPAVADGGQQTNADLGTGVLLDNQAEAKGHASSLSNSIEKRKNISPPANPAAATANQRSV